MVLLRGHRVLKGARFALYGTLVGGSLVALAVGHSVVVPVAGLLLCGTLGVVGLDLYRSVLVRLGTLLLRTGALLEKVAKLQSVSESVERRSKTASGDLHEVAISIAHTRAAVEQTLASPSIKRKSGRARVLFVTSNGSGMGHLTRLMAVAMAGRSSFDSTFVSLSSAAEIAARQGFPVVRIASQSVSGLTWPEWNRRFAARFGDLIDELQPQVVVFDGIRVFRGVYERTHHHGVPLVWVCRGLWKKGLDVSQLQHWRDVASEIILPTEGALVDSADSVPGLVQGGIRVDPIVHPSANNCLSRAEALAELRLAPNRRYVLIQLGSGVLGDRTVWERAAVGAVNALGRDWQAVYLRSPLAPEGRMTPDDALVLRHYPISEYLRAFDFSITAAGYNTVHEHITMIHPAIYVPDQNMLADDQQRRARLLMARGAGLVVEDLSLLPAAVSALASPAKREKIKFAISQLQRPSGATSAAGVIEQLIAVPHDVLAPTWFFPEEEN